MIQLYYASIVLCLILLFISIRYALILKQNNIDSINKDDKTFIEFESKLEDENTKSIGFSVNLNEKSNVILFYIILFIIAFIPVVNIIITVFFTLASLVEFSKKRLGMK